MDRKTGEKQLKERIKTGKISRSDVTRRLAELAFGKANDCVRLALEDGPNLGRLDARSSATTRGRWRSSSSTG